MFDDALPLFPTSLAAPLEEFASLARYRTIRTLGSGGMADTFVAERLDSIGHERVCLKRLHAFLASDESQRARFIDEARVLTRLCHPNVVTVLDAGTDLDGPFLVTELVDGLDLRQLLSWLAASDEPMPERIAARIAEDVLEALAHAHAEGVIHRDVTPANVLLARDGRVVLIDFGIARSELQSERTRTGLVKGKTPYMAPEQALGKPLDARTDLFAVGVVLFEMLAGRRPHDGASDVETVTNALRGKRKRLDRELTDPRLEALALAMLAPAPDDRPADARAALRALGETERCDARELAAWVRAACAARRPRREGPGAAPSQAATERLDRALGSEPDATLPGRRASEREVPADAPLETIAETSILTIERSSDAVRWWDATAPVLEAEALSPVALAPEASDEASDEPTVERPSVEHAPPPPAPQAKREEAPPPAPGPRVGARATLLVGLGLGLAAGGLLGGLLATAL